MVILLLVFLYFKAKAILTKHLCNLDIKRDFGKLRNGHMREICLEKQKTLKPKPSLMSKKYLKCGTHDHRRFLVWKKDMAWRPLFIPPKKGNGQTRFPAASWLAAKFAIVAQAVQAFWTGGMFGSFNILGRPIFFEKKTFREKKTWHVFSGRKYYVYAFPQRIK